MARNGMIAAVAVAVMVAALVAGAAAAVKRTDYYALGDTTCSGTLYVAVTETVASCTPVSCYATADDRQVVTCPSSYNLTIPLTSGTYGVGYLYDSNSTCSSTNVIGSGMSLVTLELCSAFGDGYTKTSCGSTPIVLYCSDSACTSCVTFAADGDCYGVPSSNVSALNFCSSAPGAGSRLSAVLLAAALVAATFLAGAVF